jgi:hypothetical protein
MFRLGLFTLIFLLYGTAFAGAVGGDGVGNAGDTWDKLFEDGRKLALKSLQRMDECSLESEDIPAPVRLFLLTYKAEMIDDIKVTKYAMGPHNIAYSCGWTPRQSKAPIIFGTIDCAAEKKYTVDDAAWLIIHETIHHFGYDEEVFPRAVAKAVEYSRGRPSCTHYIWDEKSCRQEDPNSQVSEGDFVLYSRARHCQSDEDCHGWVYSTTPQRSFHDANDNVVTLPAYGKVTVSIDPRRADVAVTTIGNRPCSVFKHINSCDMAVDNIDLYEKMGTQRQKLSFSTVYAGHCLRQRALLKFQEPGKSDWVETEHIVFFSK